MVEYSSMRRTKVIIVSPYHAETYTNAWKTNRQQKEEVPSHQ